MLLVACSSHAPSQTVGRTPPGVRGTASARPTPSTGAARERPRRLEIRPAGFSLPVAVQRTLSRVFTLTLDPGALPLQVTPTTLRATSGGLEISGLTGRLVLGPGAPTG